MNSNGTVNKPLNVAVVSTSMRPDSRSRLLAARIADQLGRAGASAGIVDLAAISLPMYHGGELTPEQSRVIGTLQQAEAYVFCVGIYNAGVNASAHNLMHWMLDPGEAKHKPFFLGVSAGSISSLYSTEAFARSLFQEIGAVQVSPACFVTDDADFTGPDGVSAELAPRIERASRALIVFGLAARQLREHAVSAAS